MIQFKNFINEKTKLIGIKEKFKIDVYNNYIDFLKDHFKITEDIELSVRKPSKNVMFGYIDLVSMSKGKYKIIVQDGSLSTVLSRIAHEYTHVAQFLKGHLNYTDDLQHILWYDNEYISIKELQNVTKNLDEYKKLPWEAEAYKNQADMNKIYEKSHFFKDLKDSADDTLKFVLDNLF